jgi:uncharacterized protein (DUF1501 family)
MDRRTFLKATPLIAAGGLVPEFLARAAPAVKPGGDTVLVVVEMTGGNDGLNTVIPYTDPLYYKARPKLGIRKDRAVRLNADLGLHPSTYTMDRMFQKGELAVVLGVGYPNPNRSHFESMDIWQTADPKGEAKTGWIRRSLAGLTSRTDGFPAIHVAPGTMPLAMRGGAGAVSVSDPSSFKVQLSGDPNRSRRRKSLLESINKPAAGAEDDLAAFVRRRQVQTLRGVEVLGKLVEGRSIRRRPRFRPDGGGLPDRSFYEQLSFIGELIKGGAGARIYYAKLDGFDTHSDQEETHNALLNTLSGAISNFFRELGATEHQKRTLVLTYSEFGRRVRENGSRGTDHGSGSHLFVAGPAVKGGVVGKYPRLDDLADGDLKYAIDFRRIYATLLDKWLGCASKDVLGGTFEHVPLLAKA